MVHRHVLVSMSDGWMEEHLPAANEDVSISEHAWPHHQGDEKLTHKQGTIAYWVTMPDVWNPGRLEAILRFMYLEGMLTSISATCLQSIGTFS